MKWEIDKNRPICPQIAEQICARIVDGDYQPNERIPSVRDIAMEAGANPNTVQKAFELLESENIVYSVRGTGWFAAEDTAPADSMREETIRRKAGQLISELRIFGLTSEEILEYVRRGLDE